MCQPGTDYLLTGEGDPVVTTVQRAGNPVTDALVAIAAPEAAAPGAREDCRDGGFEAFGFKNQGLCIASLNANDNAGPHPKK